MQANGKPSIMVVDDQHGLGGFLGGSLGDALRRHYDLTIAGDGAAALRAVTTDEVDALIVGSLAPGPEELDLLGRIAALPRAPVAVLLTRATELHRTMAGLDPRVYRFSGPWRDDHSHVLRRAIEQRREVLVTRELAQHQGRVIEQLDRLATLGTMTSSLLHEIRSPLSCLVSDYDWLRTELGANRSLRLAAGDSERMLAAANPELAPVLEVIDECGLATERIREIVESVRRFARGDETDEAVELSTCVEQSQRLLRHRLKSGKHVEVDIAAGLCVAGKEARLSQVFVNLLGNAIDAVERAGHVWVRGYRRESIAVLEVSDDGPGVPDSVLPRLFQPFNSSKAETGGTGLGLSVARQIVRGFGGDIVYRRREGGGALFEISLPLVDEPSRVA